MFEWDDKYLVGDIFLDSEHKLLFAMAKRLSDALGQLSSDEFKTMLANIIEYTQVHFKHEEELLQEIGWSELSQHHEQHVRILTEIKETISSTNKITTLEVKILRLLQKWIVDHIVHDDQQFRSDLIRVRGFRKVDCK